MAVAFVQAKPAISTTGGGETSIAVTLDAAATNGNTIVVHVWAAGGSITASDDASGGTNTYNTVHTHADGIAVLRAYNIHGTPSVITASFASSAYSGIVATEISGAATAADPVNAQEITKQTNPGTGTNAISSAGTASTSVANCLLVGFTRCSYDASTINPGTSYTGRVNQANSSSSYRLRTEDRTLASAGSAHATFTDALGSILTYITSMVAIAPPATTNIKTINGLANASVKTIEGLARASVKTVVGLT